MALPSPSPGPKLAYRDLYGEAYHVYYVSFKYRPMGMLVEDRDGVCTVVELQNEDSGELGQAEKEGVRVDDAIVNVMGKDTTNIDFTTITEAIRSASLPFTIGFARPVIAKEDDEAPVLSPAYQQEQEQVQEEQQPERVVQAQAIAHPFAAPPPPLIDLTTSPIPTDPVSVAPPQAVTAVTAAAIGRRLHSHASVPDAHAHQYMPIAPVPSSQPQHHAVVQQHQGGGGDPVTGGYIADYLKKAWDQTPGNLDTLLEDLGRRALTNFINRPLDDDDYDDDEGDGWGGRKRKKRRKRVGGDGAFRHRAGLLSDDVDARTLCPPEASRAIQEVRERYMRLRNLRFENLRFTDDASEYSRAILRRAEALQRLESDVGEMLADRVLEVRQKTHELRVADPTLDEALAEKWNEVNEQRKNHLLRKRQTIDRGLLELERIAVEQIPAVSRQVDDELRVRMLPLERLMQDFSILDAEMKKVLGDCRPAGKPFRPPPPVAPPPPPPPPPPMDSVAGAEGGREGVIGVQGVDGAGRPSLEGSYYAQMPARVGAAYQIHEKDLPCAYSADGTVDPRGRIAGRRDGDGRCRWKPPPQESGMPTPEELEQFLGRFKPELEEVVLWELYKLGWQKTEAAKAHITQLHTDGLLICEQSIEPLTSAEAALFERAMGERWKDFHFAAKLTKKSTKSCIAYYYYQFKGSDAYQRLRIRSVVVTEGGYAASGEDGVDVTGAPYGGFMHYAYAPPPDGLAEG